MWSCGIEKKDHLVKWADVCRPKDWGGSGIGHFQEKNYALLGKWLWRFSCEKDRLWQSIIRNKYGSDPNGWDCSSRISPPMPLLWKHVISLISLFLPYVRFGVDGKKISFWKDLWWGDNCLSSSYARLFHLSNQKDASIVEILSPLCGHVWNLTFSRAMIGKLILLVP